MNHQFGNIKLKERLPEYEPEDLLWRKIEAELDFDLNIEHAITGLPDYFPDDELWNRIEPGISKKKFFLVPVIRVTAVAASLLLILSTAFYLVNNSAKPKLTVEKELIGTEKIDAAPIALSDEKEVLAFIEENCITHKQVCQSQTFREKINLYQELSSEQVQLESTISKIGESPEMVKALIRIENMKSSALQELINIINS